MLKDSIISIRLKFGTEAHIVPQSIANGSIAFYVKFNVMTKNQVIDSKYDSRETKWTLVQGGGGELHNI